MERAETSPSSKSSRVAGLIVTGLPALFLLLDGVMKILKLQFVIDETIRLGYPENSIVPLGIVLVLSAILYLIPTTSVLGAILITGYLGGAVATHVRFNEGAFPIIFPVIIGALIWLGLYLRDAQLRALIPLRVRP